MPPISGLPWRKPLPISEPPWQKPGLNRSDGWLDSRWSCWHPYSRRVAFSEARAEAGRARYFREQLRALFLNWVLPDWETLYRSLAFGRRAQVPIPLDSG